MSSGEWLVTPQRVLIDFLEHGVELGLGSDGEKRRGQRDLIMPCNLFYRGKKIKKKIEEGSYDRDLVDLSYSFARLENKSYAFEACSESDLIYMKQELFHIYQYFLPKYEAEKRERDLMMMTVKECVVCKDTSPFELLVCGHPVCPACYVTWDAVSANNRRTTTCPCCRSTAQETVPLGIKSKSYAECLKL